MPYSPPSQIGGKDRDADAQHRPRGGPHRDAEARDDVGAVTRGGGLRDVPDRRELGAGIELGDPDQRGGQCQADEAGAEHLELAAGRSNGVVRNQPDGDEVEGDQRQAARDRQAFVERRHHVFHSRRRFDEEAADDRAEDRDGAQRERVEHRVDRCGRDQQRAEHHGGDDRDRIGLEQVGRHARAVTDVVADVVGDHGRVARIVLRNAGFDLADQIGADVGAFGEDAAAEPREDRDQRGAERKADQRRQQLGQRRAVCQISTGRQEPVERRNAEQPEADHEHPGDRAAAERHVERGADAARGGLRGAHVGAHRDIHADKAAGPREHRADHEADRGAQIEKERDQDREHDADNPDRLVLARQIRCRAGLDRCSDLLHAGVARVLRQNPAASPKSVAHGHQSADQRQHQRGIACHVHLLE